MTNRTPEGDRHGYVGELIDPDWSPEPEEQIALPVQPPHLPGAPKFPKPGIYFGMSDEAYHAINAASTSGLKNLSVSGMDYWANSPMNDAKPERSNRFFDFGKAIHCLVLEGVEAYEARYVIGLDKSQFDPKKLLTTIDQIKRAIVELGHKPTTKGFDDNTRTAKKDDWIEQLLALDPEALIWEQMVAAHEKKHAGKEEITPEIDRRVRVAARMISADPEVGPAMTGGFPEVAVFWHCRKTGIAMKAKFDLLQLKRIVDLKSFSNKNGKPINRAIETTIANYNYNMQHVIYDEGAVAVRSLVRERGIDAIACHPAMSLEKRADCIVFALEWAEQEEPPEFLFVFQKSDLAPVTRGKIMPRAHLFSTTIALVELLKRDFLAYSEVYGVDPWLDIEPIEVLDDERIPPWATEIGKVAA